MNTARIGRAAAFWSSVLEGVDAPTPLTIDLPPDSRTQANEVNIRHACDCAARNSDPAFWVAAWALLLGRYANEDKVLFGHGADGKVRPVLAVLDWQQAFSAWPGELASWLRKSQSFPYQSIEELKAAYTSIPSSSSMVESVIVGPGQTIGDFAATIVVRIEDSGFSIDFDSRRLERDAVRRLATHLETLATSVLDDPEGSLIDAVLLPQDEYNRVVVEWNATEVDFPADKCLHQLFEDQVALQPEAPAVTYDGRTLAYQELNWRANQIAHRLLELGVKPDTAVGISLHRSIDMTAALMGNLVGAPVV